MLKMLMYINFALQLIVLSYSWPGGRQTPLQSNNRFDGSRHISVISGPYIDQFQQL